VQKRKADPEGEIDLLRYIRGRERKMSKPGRSIGRSFRMGKTARPDGGEKGCEGWS